MASIINTIIIARYHHKSNRFSCSRHLYSVSPESGIIIGLDGAIQRIILNGEVMVSLQRRALDSLAVRDYTGAPCSDSPCDNGATCVPHFRRPLCVCPPGFRGRHCKARDAG